MLDPDQLFLAVVALNGLFASLAWCLARTNVASVLSVVTFAVIWPFVDKPLGGRTVHEINPGNGITEGDFLSVFAVILAAFLAVKQWKRIRQDRSDTPPVAEGREVPNVMRIGPHH